MGTNRNAGRRSRRRKHGHTLLELALALVVFMIGSGGIVLCQYGSSRLRRATQETEQAMTAALSVVDQMHSVPFTEVFARFNATKVDDPAGSSPGCDFDVRGLEALAGDADKLPGEIVFPGDGIQLLELVNDPGLGMPRDLNGDEDEDSEDAAASYVVLPARVVVAWQSQDGPRRVEVVTTLAMEKTP